MTVDDSRILSTVVMSTQFCTVGTANGQVASNLAKLEKWKWSRDKAALVSWRLNNNGQKTELALSLQKKKLYFRPPPTPIPANGPPPPHPTFAESWQLGIYHSPHHLGRRPETPLWGNWQPRGGTTLTTLATPLKRATSPSDF